MLLNGKVSYPARLLPNKIPKASPDSASDGDLQDEEGPYLGPEGIEDPVLYDLFYGMGSSKKSVKRPVDAPGAWNNSAINQTGVMWSLLSQRWAGCFSIFFNVAI